jgi:signal peptidase
MVSIKKKDIIEIVVAFFAAWLFYQGLGFATGTEMPMVSVVSDSMEPMLHRGDLLVVVKAEDLKEGDIVVYRRSIKDITIVHRIKEIQGDTYIIKGDNNPGPDPPVQRDMILGKIVGGAPLLGYPRMLLSLTGI